MYATTIEEVVEDAILITCILFIHSAPSIALFNFGSKHTFIAKKFIDMIGVSIDDLRYDLVVSTPTGLVLTCGVCVSGVTIVIV